MTASLPPLYLPAQPVDVCRIGDVTSVPTVVVHETDWKMARMADLMDGVFSSLAEALVAAGLTPIGPAFCLHHRMPAETADLEVGFPVDGTLAEAITLPSGFTADNSRLPAGRVALHSHVGPYDQLPESWGNFVERIGRSGERMTLPFWEIYVTEPGPDEDPASMRTDLMTLLEE